MVYFCLPCQNILVISKYYARITLKRLAELLCLSVQVRMLVMIMCRKIICGNWLFLMCLGKPVVLQINITVPSQ